MDVHKTANTVWHNSIVEKKHRERATNGPGLTCWLTGLSGSGKSSIAVELENQLLQMGKPAFLLDGDNLRHGLNGDLGFSAEDRTENIRRAAHVSLLFASAGVVAITPLVSPYQSARMTVKNLHLAANIKFVEVFVDTPLHICEQRDSKGLYKKARAGLIKGMTGIDDPYEPPQDPDFTFTPEDGTPATVATTLLNKLQGFITLNKDD